MIRGSNGGTNDAYMSFTACAAETTRATRSADRSPARAGIG